MYRPPSFGFRVFMRKTYISRDRNVCLLAPLRRPKPNATPGATMGRFAMSPSRAIPVWAALS